MVEKYDSSHSYHASIESYNADRKLGYVCSGAIVSVNHVLTTAQCVADRSLADLRVRAGSSQLEKYGILYEVKKLLYRRNFNVTRNNVALVRIKNYFHIEIIKLKLFQNVHEFDARADFNDTALVTAYERNHTRLTARNVTAYRSNNCKLALIRSPEKINCHGFYSSASGTDECFTHVGGVVVVDKQLVGFVLYPNCNRTLVPGGLYMELFRFYDWVADRAEDHV